MLQTVPEVLPARQAGEATKRLWTDAIAANTRRAYTSALASLDHWLGDRPLTDEALAAYLGHLDEEGKAPGTAELAVTAARFRAKVLEQPSPAGPQTEMALKGFRREGRAERGRGQSDPFTADQVQLMQGRAFEPRPRGRGMESAALATERGRVDAALVGLLFQTAMRRSEAAALEWRDIEPGRDAGTLLVTVRKSKTNQDGQKDIRFMNGAPAKAVEILRAHCGAQGLVFGGMSDHTINRRVKALAAHCGLKGRFTSHSGRIGLASELTFRGASEQEVMNAGNWKGVGMVRHYSAGAVAERGAVAKYL